MPKEWSKQIPDEPGQNSEPFNRDTEKRGEREKSETRSARHSERERQGEKNERGGEKKEALFSMLKNVFQLGSEASQFSEEVLKVILKDLSKDITQTVSNGIAKGRQELRELVHTEIIDFLQEINLQKIVTQFMESHEIEVVAKIRLKPKGSEGSSLRGKVKKVSKKKPNLKVKLEKDTASSTDDLFERESSLADSNDFELNESDDLLKQEESAEDLLNFEFSPKNKQVKTEEKRVL